MRDILSIEEFEAHCRDPYAHHVNRISAGKAWAYEVDNDDWNDIDIFEIDVDFVIHNGITILYCLDDRTAYGGDCSSVVTRLKTDENGAVVPLDETTGYGCIIQYKTTQEPPSEWGFYIGVAYILFGSGFEAYVYGEGL